MTRNLNSMTLRQEIILALSVKTILLFALWAVCFSGARDLTPDTQQASAPIRAPNSTKEPNHDANHRAR